MFARSNFILPPTSSNSLVHQNSNTSNPSGLIFNLQQIQAGFDLRTISTGQHRYITIPVPFNVPPAHQSSSPADLSNKMQRKWRKNTRGETSHRPGWVLYAGDHHYLVIATHVATTTGMSSAMTICRLVFFILRGSYAWIIRLKFRKNNVLF